MNCNNLTVTQIFNKLHREIYRFMHPKLWMHELQINGIPKIVGTKYLKLGYNVSINDKVFLQCGGGITIGNNVTLSRGCTILTEGLNVENYSLNSKKKYRDHVSNPVIIGDGVWIAANVTVCPGSVIPNNCVVAAGACVVGKLKESNCLYGGIPARKIRMLE